MAKSYDYLFKILLIGDRGVGKKTILHKFIEDASIYQFVPAMGVDFHIRTVEIDGKQIKLQIWVAAGKDRLFTISPSYYRGANGIVYVYDIKNGKSFDNITKWMDNVDRSASDDVVKMLIGNKSDATDKRAVPKEKGELVGFKYGINFIETSAKDFTNVKEAFFSIARHIKENKEKKLEASRESYDGHMAKTKGPSIPCSIQ